jgi:hypothetical protein
VFKISSQILPPKVKILKIKEHESRVPNQTLQIHFLVAVLNDHQVLQLSDQTARVLQQRPALQGLVKTKEIQRRLQE